MIIKSYQDCNKKYVLDVIEIQGKQTYTFDSFEEKNEFLLSLIQFQSPFMVLKFEGASPEQPITPNICQSF